MEPCGYIKANKLTSEYIVRQDMHVMEEALTISISDYKNKQLAINKENKSKNVNVKTAFYINENGMGISKDFERKENNKYWASISSNLSEKQINSMLSDYKSRTKLINTIIDNVVENDINGVIIDINEKQTQENIMRFVIELAPKLREFGISTGIVLNKNMVELFLLY